MTLSSNATFTPDGSVDLCPNNARWPHDRTKLIDKTVFRDFVLEIVCRAHRDPDFELLPRRRVAERTFGWMTRLRRLVRNYETRLDMSEAMIHGAMGSLLLRRVAHS